MSSRAKNIPPINTGLYHKQAHQARKKGTSQMSICRSFFMNICILCVLKWPTLLSVCKNVIVRKTTAHREYKDLIPWQLHSIKQTEEKQAQRSTLSSSMNPILF